MSLFKLKAMEALVAFDIRGQLLSKSHHAYWKGKLTETLRIAVGRLDDSLERKELSLAAFLEIKGGFNNVKVFSMI